MQERFIGFLFKRLGEKLENVQSASSSEEIDVYTDELGTYLDELRSVVGSLIGIE